jgi:hypothetical protein
MPYADIMLESKMKNQAASAFVASLWKQSLVYLTTQGAGLILTAIAATTYSK